MWKKYKQDESGNFSIMMGFSLMICMLLIAAAIEISRMSSAKTKIQNIADSAALAGAIAADQRAEDRIEQVQSLIEANIDPRITLETPVITFDDNAQTVSVELNGQIPSFLSSFLGKDRLNFSAVSESLFAPESIAPISVVFALDVSGSMGSPTDDGDIKIETLKESIEVLFTSLESGSKNKDMLLRKLRTGMSAYNTALVEEQDMDFGWDDLSDAVDDLVAEGGTNSVPALENAYAQLVADRDVRVSQGENLDSLIEFVVFMTDGVNNQDTWDDESLELCRTMKADNIDIYSIAFAAPEQGQALLLDCATSNSGEENDDPDSKCMNNGSKGAGQANGHCDGKKKEDLEEAKSNYYFDASDAKTFKKAFDEIGESVASVYIRIL